MTPLERLLAEAIPTRPTPPDPHTTWTPEQQAQHQTDLLEALHDWTYNRDHRNHRHLLNKPDPQAA